MVQKTRGAPDPVTVSRLRNGNNPSMDAPGNGRVKDDTRARESFDRSAARYTEPQTAKVGG